MTITNIPDDVVAQVVAAAVEEHPVLSTEGVDAAAIVRTVIQAFLPILDNNGGEPLGQRRMHADGRIAIRFNDNGVHKWRIIGLDGTVESYDLQPVPSPAADWPILSAPAN